MSCSIFWVRADSEARFTQDYSDLAKIADLPPDLKGEVLLSAVQQWIEQQTNWLLILDNADDLRVFKKTYSASQGHSCKVQSSFDLCQKPRQELLSGLPATAVFLAAL